MRGAHDDEQQSARPGARREVRAAGRASRVGACCTVRPDAPNKNYTIKHNMLIMNKRQTIRFVLLRCYAVCTVCSIFITVKSTLDVKSVFFQIFFDKKV